MIGKILRAVTQPRYGRYGIRGNHAFRKSYEKYIADIVTAANSNTGRSAYDALGPKKYSQVRPSTLLRSGGGLWKRIAENWEVADFCARDPESHETARRAAVFKWLAYNEAFLLEVAIESGVWETWLPASGPGSIPPTMIFDDRFDFSEGDMPRTELPELLARELAATAERLRRRADRKASPVQAKDDTTSDALG